MEKIKTILDRPVLNTGYIRSKQDFKRIEQGCQKLEPPIHSRTWFYGAVGIAIVSLIIGVRKLSESITSNSFSNVKIKDQMAA